MLVYRRTSLLESSAQTLVNTVNCVGVMGKGIAKEFKDRDPSMFKAYKKICEEGKLEPGKLWLWRGVDYWTLNFPTKVHWRNPSRLEWIEAGLKKFVAGYEKLGVREISFPRLGCGNGGLDWDDVRPLMERYLERLTIPVYVHDYTVDIGWPEHLEELQAALKSRSIDSYQDFLSCLAAAISLSDGNFVDLNDRKSFRAAFLEDETLRIFSHAQEWDFDHDALWTVWISLQKGLLSSERIGWATSEGGRQLLSLVSLLPGMRPIEVQEAHGEKQIAVEYRSGSRTSSVVGNNPKGQLTLSWH